MINISLKAKHFYLIAGHLKDRSAFYSQVINNSIQVATAGKLEDDTAAIDIEVPKFVEIFQMLSGMPEGQYNRCNSEMMDLLTPQIEAGVQSGDPEWIDAANQVNAIREVNWAVSTEMINKGKAFIDTI